MAIMRITCPECGAGLKSPDGFTVGQEVECPKCSTEFEVEKPVAAKTTALAPSQTKALSKKTTRLSARDEDDEDDKPKKKKKKKKTADDEEEWSYKNSWIRYAVLGVLLVVLAVLGYMLYLKKKKEKENADAKPSGNTDNTPTLVQGGPGLKQGGPIPKLNPLPNPGAPGGGFPSAQPGVIPKKNNFPAQPAGGGGGSPLDQLLGGGPGMSPQEREKIKNGLSAKLVGTWTADLGGGKTQTVTYTPDGKFTETGAKSQTGTWRVSELLGTRGLALARTGQPAEVNAVFEGDELIHDTADRGVSGVFRRK